MAEPRGAQFRSPCRFELGGKTYEYRGYLSAADALLLKQHAGFGSLEWVAALQMGDPGALVGLVLITLRQSGERVTWDEVVDRIDGDDDVWALLASVEPITADGEPAEKVEPAPAAKPGPRNSRTKKEPAPATA